MSSTITEGTLVRVKRDTKRITPDEYAMTHPSNHGDLWVCIKAEGMLFDDLHAFVSLTTGRHYAWYDNEVEVPDEEA